jgi:hypothetical protein
MGTLSLCRFVSVVAECYIIGGLTMFHTIVLQQNLVRCQATYETDISGTHFSIHNTSLRNLSLPAPHTEEPFLAWVNIRENTYRVDRPMRA